MALDKNPRGGNCRWSKWKKNPRGQNLGGRDEDETLRFQQNPRGNNYYSNGGDNNRDDGARVEHGMAITTYRHNSDDNNVGHDDGLGHDSDDGDR